MSATADFFIRLDVEERGTIDAKDKMQALLDVVRNGTQAFRGNQLIVAQTRKEYYEKVKAMRYLRNEFQVAHPSLMLFSRGLSQVASVARMGIGIFNSLNLMLIAQRQSTNNLADVDRAVDVAWRNYQDALRLYVDEDHPRVIKAAEEYTTALNNQKSAHEDAKDEAGRNQAQMVTMALYITAFFIPALVKIVDAWNNIKTAAKLADLSVKAYIASQIVALAPLATSIAAVLLPLTAFAAGYDVFLKTTKGGIKSQEDVNEMWGKLSQNIRDMDVSFLPPELQGAYKALAYFGAATVLAFVDMAYRIESALKIPSDAIKGVNDKIQGLVDAVKGIGGTITDFLADPGKKLREWLFGVQQDSESTRSEFTGKFGRALSEVQKAIHNALPKELKDLLDWLDDIKKDSLGSSADFKKNIEDAIGGVQTKIGDFLKEQGANLKTWLADVQKGAKDMSDDLREAIKDATKDASTDIGNFLDGAGRNLRNWIIDVINYLRELLGLREKAAAPMPPGATTAPVTKVGEGYQFGGYVPETGLAMLHAGELVIPADRVARGGGGGRTLYIGEINITVPTSREQADEISRKIVLELNRYMRWL